jgi:hypothetical protein
MISQNAERAQEFLLGLWRIQEIADDLSQKNIFLVML